MKRKPPKIEDINYKLQLSYMYDLKKPRINRFERAKIVADILASKKISLRGLARELKVGASTLSGWMKWNDISENEYLAMKVKGITDTEITNMLKGTQKKNIEGVLWTQIDMLSGVLDKINSTRISIDGIERITQLRNKINQIIYRNEQR